MTIMDATQGGSMDHEPFGEMVPGITITRERIYSRNRSGPQWRHWYRAVGPDGQRFDNGSIVELRSVLRRHYGRNIELSEPGR